MTRIVGRLQGTTIHLIANAAADRLNNRVELDQQNFHRTTYCSYRFISMQVPDSVKLCAASKNRTHIRSQGLQVWTWKCEHVRAQKCRRFSAASTQIQIVTELYSSKRCERESILKRFMRARSGAILNASSNPAPGNSRPGTNATG